MWHNQDGGLSGHWRERWVLEERRDKGEKLYSNEFTNLKNVRILNFHVFQFSSVKKIIMIFFS